MLRSERVAHFQDIPQVPTHESTFEVIWNAFGQLHVIDMDEASLIAFCKKNGCENDQVARAQIGRMVEFGYLARRVSDVDGTTLYSRGRLSPIQRGVLYN